MGKLETWKHDSNEACKKALLGSEYIFIPVHVANVFFPRMGSDRICNGLLRTFTLTGLGVNDWQVVAGPNGRQKS